MRTIDEIEELNLRDIIYETSIMNNDSSCAINNAIVDKVNEIIDKFNKLLSNIDRVKG